MYNEGIIGVGTVLKALEDTRHEFNEGEELIVEELSYDSESMELFLGFKDWHLTYLWQNEYYDIIGFVLNEENIYFG